MKALFVCLTDYQLLNSINIKKHLLTEQEADIIIFNNKAGTFELADRLQQTGIFQNVYVYSECFDGIHKYLRKLSEGKKNIGFFEAINGTIKNISLKILEIIKDKEWILNQKIYKNKKINFSHYDQFFGIETKAFVGECLNLILKNNKCTNNLIDEGLASYLRTNFNEKHKVDAVYLYEPKMIVYSKNDFNSIFKIPKIKKTDDSFVNLINFVFGFKDSDKVNLENEIIFFDQNTDPMPKYLCNAGKIKRLIFHNSYNKHLQEQIVYQTKIDLFKKIVEVTYPKKVFVKLHPRSNSDYIKDYEEGGAKFLPNIYAPWEVFGCNCNVKNNLWITLYSSALFSFDFTINSTNENIKYIFLYRILNSKKKMKRFEIVDEFFSNFKSKYPDKIFLPNNEEELIKVLKLMEEEK